MDVRLAQGSSGVDAARELHARRALRCIFLSANLDEPTKTALLPYEPIDFVGKPVLPVVLATSAEKGRRSDRSLRITAPLDYFLHLGTRCVEHAGLRGLAEGHRELRS